jgi:hypothetical protein
LLLSFINNIIENSLKRKVKEKNQSITNNEKKEIQTIKKIKTESEEKQQSHNEDD